MRSLLLISIITAASAQAVFTNPADLKAAVRHSSCCDNGEYDGVLLTYTRAPSYNNSCTYNGVEIKNWDVSQITDFSQVFSGANDQCLQHFNADISSWDVSQGTNFYYMFLLAREFNQDISSWRPHPNLPTGTFYSMFAEAYAFNQNLDDWGLVNHGTANMFTKTYSLTHRPYWYTAEAFHSCFNETGCGTCGQRLHSVLQGRDDLISQLGLQTYTVTCNEGFKANVASTSCSSELCVDDNLICCENPAVFTDTDTLRAAVRDPSCCDNGEYGDFGTVTRDPSYDNSCTYNGVEIKDWDVSQITDFSQVFSGANDQCLQHFNADISSWDVSQGTNFEYMFAGAWAFNQDISSWDVSQGTNFYYMFLLARAFNQDISSWRPNPNLPTNSFTGMFSGAYNFNQNLDDWGLVNGNSDEIFDYTYSLTHRPYWYTAEASFSCFNETGCGTCGQRLHSAMSEAAISHYGLQTYTVTCNEGYKANVASTSCSSELCVDDNPICCESTCPTHKSASECLAGASVCWWNLDTEECANGCDLDWRNENLRQCSNTHHFCGNGTEPVGGVCKPACTSEGCVELVEAYKTQCD